MTLMSEDQFPRLLTSAEVAERFRVSQKSVSAWIRDGKLAAIRNPGGGAYRVRESDVEAILRGESAPDREVEPVGGESR
jgi:excisionase family DNA binding protein